MSIKINFICWIFCSSSWWRLKFLLLYECWRWCHHLCDSLIRCKRKMCALKGRKCLFFKSHKKSPLRSNCLLSTLQFCFFLQFIIAHGATKREVEGDRKFNWQNLYVYRWSIWDISSIMSIIKMRLTQNLKHSTESKNYLWLFALNKTK